MDNSTSYNYYCADCQQYHNRLQDQCDKSLIKEVKNSSKNSYFHIDNFPT